LSELCLLVGAEAQSRSVPEDVRDRAVEPFVSTRDGCAGFGLTSRCTDCSTPWRVGWRREWQDRDQHSPAFSGTQRIETL